jgi:hypothetical protein
MKNCITRGILLAFCFLIFAIDSSAETVKQKASEYSSRADVLLIPLSKGVAQDNGATPWYAVFQIGKSNSPDGDGQELKFMMDTGTSNFWVTSWQTKGSGGATHNFFSKDYSTTWTSGYQYPTVFDQQLGAWGKFTFNYGIDTFFFKATRAKQSELSSYKLRKTKPHQEKSYYVPSVEFQMAVELKDGQEVNGSITRYNRNWDQLVCDGGMGFPLYPNTTVSSDLFLDKLINDKLVTYKILAFWTDPDINRGELVIGGWNSNIVNSEEFNKLEVNDVGRKNNGWVVDLDQFMVGDQKIELPTKVGKGPNLQLDTGSSIFKGDADYINNIVAAITKSSGHGAVIYDEEKLNDFPDLTMILAGVDYILKPQQYFQKFVEYDPVTNKGTPYWKLAFEPLDGLEGILLVGSIFLDTVYSVYFYPHTFMGNQTHMIYLGKYIHK